MNTTKKLDLYKEHKSEYVTPKTPTLIAVKPVPYLSIAGKGEPGSNAFQAAVSALYGAAFTIKMTRKQTGRDYKVCSLEGLWWGPRKGRDFFEEPKNTWNWKLMIRVPSFITEKDLESAIKRLKEKGKGPEVAKVKLETIDEGQCVQMLHVGPYDTEGETIAKMKAFAKESELKFDGLHHEIYLSDPRRTAPERLRTILRHPVRKA